MKIYKEADLKAIEPVINSARVLWSIRCDEYFAQHGDVGSCVLGAGFAVQYLPKGKRKPIPLTVLSWNEVSPAQGGVVWEDSKDEVLNYLRNKGVDAFYLWGRMD